MRSEKLTSMFKLKQQILLSITHARESASKLVYTTVTKPNDDVLISHTSEQHTPLHTYTRARKKTLSVK